MKHRLVSAAILAAALLCARGAHADQSTLTYIPSDCQVAAHLDFDRINADPQLAGMLAMVWPQIEMLGAPPIASLSGLSLGIKLENFSETPDFFVALKANAALTTMPQLAAKAGLAPQTVDGRPMFVGANVALLPSNDQKMALVSMSPALVDRMMDPALGNVTTRPGFTLNPTTGAQTVMYAYIGGLEGQVRAEAEKGFTQWVATLDPNMLGQFGLTPEQAAPIAAALKDLPVILSATGAEMAFLFDTANMTQAIRLTMPNPDLAVRAKTSVEAFLEFDALAKKAFGQPVPTVQASITGSTVDVIATLDKQIAIQQLTAGISMAAMGMTMGAQGGGMQGGGGH